MSWERYEQRKAAWVQAHPNATSEEYEQAARREFRGERSPGLARRGEKRELPAPGRGEHLADSEGSYA